MEKIKPQTSAHLKRGMTGILIKTFDLEKLLTE